MPALTVHNAELKTAAVEIKTLTISGKQVTLAVFRQLQDSSVIDHDTGAFLGLPWGTVNYCPDKTCAKMRDHRHVVWQLGSELRRATVESPAWWGDRDAFWSDCSDVFVQSAYCANDHRLPEWADRRRDAEDKWAWAIYFTLAGTLCIAAEPGSPHGYNSSHKCSTADLLDEMRKEVEAEQARREQMRQRWREVTDLPQLFIAV